MPPGEYPASASSFLAPAVSKPSRLSAVYPRVCGGVKHVVVAAARRAGLASIGPHRLRHTAATQMLRAGASLPEIGQVLRHHHISTTAIYAKVDREALRTVARPWPGGVA